MKIAIHALLFVVMAVPVLDAAKIAPFELKDADTGKCSATIIKVAEKSCTTAHDPYDYSIESAMADLQSRKGKASHRHSQSWNPVEAELKEVQAVTRALDQSHPVDMTKMTGSLHDYEKLVTQLNKVGFFSALEQLDLGLVKGYLKSDKSLIYEKDRGGMGPLHTVLSYDVNEKCSDSTKKWIQTKRKDLIIFLRKNGTNVGDIDDAGMTPLHHAAVHNVELSTLKALYDGKRLEAMWILVNIKDKQGNTPLHYAIWQENAELVDYLLIFNASIYIPNKKNETPLSVSKTATNRTIVALMETRRKKIADEEACCCGCWPWC